MILLPLLSFAILSTAYSQSDTICLPIETAKELTKLAAKGKLCDSLVQNRQDIIDYLGIGIGLKNAQIELADDVIRKQNHKLEKYARRKKWLRPLIAGLVGIVAVETVIIVAKL